MLFLFSPSSLSTDGLSNSDLWAEGVFGPKLWLYVQDPHHWQQQRGQNVLLVPLRRRLLHTSLCQYGGHRLQGEDHLQEWQEDQITDLGKRSGDVLSFLQGGKLKIYKQTKHPSFSPITPQPAAGQRGLIQLHCGSCVSNFFPLLPPCSKCICFVFLLQTTWMNLFEDLSWVVTSGLLYVHLWMPPFRAHERSDRSFSSFSNWCPLWDKSTRCLFYLI